MLGLQNKKILVAGAGGDIGAATVRSWLKWVPRFPRRPRPDQAQQPSLGNWLMGAPRCRRAVSEAATWPMGHGRRDCLAHRVSSQRRRFDDHRGLTAGGWRLHCVLTHTSMPTKKADLAGHRL